jgi:ABC-type phosphate transport system ATPase subunit
MEMLLKGNDIEEIKNKINDFKGELKNCSIEDLSVNIRTNNIEKFITKSGCVKGTP